MELMTKQGYKQTEVGLIPEDWSVEPIGDLASISTGGSDTQDRIDDGAYPFFVRSQTIERINQFSFDGEAILTSGDGVGVGKIFHYVNCKFDYHQRVYNIHNYRNDVAGKYLFFQFSTNFFERVMAMTAKSSVDSVRREMIADMQIPIPPTLTEQKAIATALSDVDALIASLEQTITKKKAIKQGAMQQLLTPPHKGGKRLPGFSGEWVEKTLGKVANYQNGKALESYFNSSDGYKVVSIGNYSESGIYVNNNNFISKTLKSEIGKFILNEGELAMLLNDKTSIGTIIGRVLYIDKNEEYVFNQRTMRLSLNEGYNSRFLFHLINCNIVHQQIFLKAKPGTQIYINTADVLDLVLALPSSLEEQKAIAQILSDMDAEITQLETKKEKYQAIKQGMMQELLTGKTRLV